MLKEQPVSSSFNIFKSIPENKDAPPNHFSLVILASFSLRAEAFDNNLQSTEDGGSNVFRPLRCFCLLSPPDQKYTLWLVYMFFRDMRKTSATGKSTSQELSQLMGHWGCKKMLLIFVKETKETTFGICCAFPNLHRLRGKV